MSACLRKWGAPKLWPSSWLPLWTLMKVPKWKYVAELVNITISGPQGCLTGSQKQAAFNSVEAGQGTLRCIAQDCWWITTDENCRGLSLFSPRSLSSVFLAKDWRSEVWQTLQDCRKRYSAFPFHQQWWEMAELNPKTGVFLEGVLSSNHISSIFGHQKTHTK